MTDESLEIVDYQAQSSEAKAFADRVESVCSANRRRLGYRGYFNTNGDAILTAYLAGLRATKKESFRLIAGVGRESEDGE
jgi:hypothetical protein